MATNPETYYGSDLACINDADEMFSEAVGLPVVVQDALHRLTCDSVLGPNGDDWGFDCRNLSGMKSSELVMMQPTLIEVLTRDDRIESADVELTAVEANGLTDTQIAATLYTAEGPFSFTRLISELTVTDLENL
jgi:hypothetical protein